MFGDCHMHIFMNGSDYRAAVRAMRDGQTEAVVREHLGQYQKQNITFLRDGGDHYGASVLARELAPEYGITYRTPVFAIHKRGHYGKVVGRSFENLKEYEMLVREAIDADADFIKIMISGIVDFDRNMLTESGVDPKEISEMIHIAHEYGKAVMAHANGAETVMAAVDAGVDSVEHGYFMNEECVEMLAKSNTIYVPTVSTVRNLIGDERFPTEMTTALYEKQKQIIRQCYQSGVKLALGSDAGAYLVPHGRGICDEWETMKEILGEHEDLETKMIAGEQEIRQRFS